MSAETSERKGCWGCLVGLFTVLAVGYGILKWASLPLIPLQFWKEVKDEERRQNVATAVDTAKLYEEELVKQENSGVIVLLLENKSYRLYYPTVMKITKGRAADRAGLHEGDRILRINGDSVLQLSRKFDLKKTLETCRSKSVPVIVMRGSERVTITLDVPADRDIGIQLDMLKKQ